MATDDWLVGRDRHSEAAERIYAAAADLMSRQGYDAFSIDTLAAAVHCSPATIYRHTGGKAAIRDAVLGLQAERILESVREAIAGLTACEPIRSHRSCARWPHSPATNGSATHPWSPASPPKWSG